MDKKESCRKIDMMTNFYGVFIGHGIALISMCHYPDAKAPLIFVGVGLVILEILGLASGLRNWRLLNTRIKHLVFRMIVFIMINIFLITFFILTVDYGRRAIYLDVFRDVVIANSIIFYLYSILLFIIQTTKYFIFKEKVKATKKLKSVSTASAPTSEEFDEEEIYENGDVFLKSDI